MTTHKADQKPTRKCYRRRRWHQLLATTGLTMALGLGPTVAGASDDEQASDSDRAAAQVLFDKGRDQMGEEDYEAACKTFAESMRLDRAIGTQLNLANCYEKIGKTASAWINFVEGKSRAQKEGQDGRVRVASERIEVLKEQLSMLKIVVPYELEGLKVTRDDTTVGQAQWGTDMPTDPGTHEIKVVAPGKLPWTTTIDVGEDADQVEIEIPQLEDAPVEPDPVVQPEASDGTMQMVGGITAGALGVIGLGLGITFGVLAGKKNDLSTSTDYCPNDPTQCTAKGVDLRNKALTYAHVSTTGFVVGGVGLAAGAFLLLTLPAGEDSGADESDDEDADMARIHLIPWLEAHDQGSAGLILRGTW